MIIELAGLPGAGKTTVCDLVAQPHGSKGDVPFSAMRPSRPLLRATWHILVLCLTARPFRLQRLQRAFNLVVFLRHYVHHERCILLDQGIVQKLWSILADAEFHSDARLEAVICGLSPFAVDHVVWLEIPLEAAARRIDSRHDGRSRYDAMSPQSAAHLLEKRAPLLRSLAGRFCAASGANLLVIDGGCDPAENARRIDALIARRSTR